MADLEKYQAKRHAGKTPEPLTSEGGRKGKAPIFVVQRHSATRLHYDFRLERDGVLLSWALPRGVPLRAGERALAVHVEDHPLEYASFEGEIPAGEYGGGTVDIWDTGTYELVHERKNGQLTVLLHGTRLEGEWALIPAHLDGQERNWLILRASKLGALGPARTYEPMWPRPAKRIPTGADWVFELAWVGVRALAPVEGAKGRFEHGSKGPFEHGSKGPFEHARGESLDARTRHLLAQMPRALTTSECVLDGVICALDDDGRPSLDLLEQGGGTMVYMVVDVLDFEGTSLVGEPWSRRRSVLEELLDERVDDLRLSRAHEDGAQLREAARSIGLGIVAKRPDSRYRPGAVSDTWRLLEP